MSESNRGDGDRADFEGSVCTKIQIHMLRENEEKENILYIILYIYNIYMKIYYYFILRYIAHPKAPSKTRLNNIYVIHLMHTYTYICTCFMRIHMYALNNNNKYASCTFAHYRRIYHGRMPVLRLCTSLRCTFTYISGAW